jgi:4-amino-4-deoxy-L-arabinose transferase-like glycosyltransferase
MRHHSPSTWAAICVLIAAAVHLALGFSIEFSVDEAHYALYASHLAWSYFDHPPLVGWIQWPLITLTSSEGLIRLIPELLWVLSSYLVFQVTSEIHRLLQHRNTDYLTQALPSAGACGLMAVLTIIASPIPHVLAIGLLPDTLLTPISLGLMMMALRWLRKDSLKQSEWILMGVLLGLAGLSKYTAAFTALALLFVFLSAPKKPWINSSGFWLAAGLALTLICPVLYWNATHGWISFQYQLAHGGGSSWAWRRVAAFIGVQIACFGPALALGGILFIKQHIHSRRLVLSALFSFFLIPFLIFAALSGGGGLPHWTTPAWFCLAPFAGIGLAKAWPQRHRIFSKIIKGLLIIQILLCMVGFGFVLAGGIPSIAVKSNPIADLYGWKSAGERAAQIAKDNHLESIAVQNWTLASRAAWYARPLPVFVLDQRQDQFDIWFGQLSPGANTLLVNWSGMPFNAPIGTKSAFEECKVIDSLEIVRFGQFLSKFDYSLCTNWHDH